MQRVCAVLPLKFIHFQYIVCLYVEKLYSFCLPRFLFVASCHSIFSYKIFSKLNDMICPHKITFKWIFYTIWQLSGAQCVCTQRSIVVLLSTCVRDRLCVDGVWQYTKHHHRNAEQMIQCNVIIFN